MFCKNSFLKNISLNIGKLLFKCKWKIEKGGSGTQRANQLKIQMQ